MPTLNIAPPMWWRRKQPLGAQGEALAARYLRWRGYRILHRNLKIGSYEIDLVAQKGDTVAFVEVKTRLYADAIRPEDNVGPVKQRHIRTAAKNYIARNFEEETYYRLDVIAIVWPEQGKPEVTHFPDAFR